jgi:hypothetical protein
MNNEALKAWLDAMPIDDVRRRIERLEAKLADLRVLERIYEDRHGAAPADAVAEPAEEPAPEAAGEAETDPPAEPSAEWQPGG